MLIVMNKFINNFTWPGFVVGTSPHEHTHTRTDSTFSLVSDAPGGDGRSQVRGTYGELQGWLRLDYRCKQMQLPYIHLCQVDVNTTTHLLD